MITSCFRHINFKIKIFLEQLIIFLNINILNFIVIIYLVYILLENTFLQLLPIYRIILKSQNLILMRFILVLILLYEHFWQFKLLYHNQHEYSMQSQALSFNPIII